MDFGTLKLLKVSANLNKTCPNVDVWLWTVVLMTNAWDNGYRNIASALFVPEITLMASPLTQYVFPIDVMCLFECTLMSADPWHNHCKNYQ